MADQDIDKEQIRSASLSREGAPEVTLARSTDFACFLTNLSMSFHSSRSAYLPRALASSADVNCRFRSIILNPKDPRPSTTGSRVPEARPFIQAWPIDTNGKRQDLML